MSISFSIIFLKLFKTFIVTLHHLLIEFSAEISQLKTFFMFLRNSEILRFVRKNNVQCVNLKLIKAKHFVRFLDRQQKKGRQFSTENFQISRMNVLKIQDSRSRRQKVINYIKYDVIRNRYSSTFLLITIYFSMFLYRMIVWR